MEPRFKTSFIPKQSFAAPPPTTTLKTQKHGLGVAGLASITVFVVSLVACGGVFAYKYYLESAIAEKALRLQAAREAFQPDLIRLLERLDNRLKAANELLAKHAAPTAFFTLLESVTYQDVQFNKMALTQPENRYVVTLEGIAKDFDAVALQADLFGVNRYILLPVFSNLNVAAGRTGVTFTAQIEIDRTYLMYAQHIQNRGAIPEPQPIPQPLDVSEFPLPDEGVESADKIDEAGTGTST